jgi:hypothetical protein
MKIDADVEFGTFGGLFKIIIRALAWMAAYDDPWPTSDGCTGVPI